MSQKSNKGKNKNPSTRKPNQINIKIDPEVHSLSREELIELQAEAYYQAMKRIENEKEMKKAISSESKVKWWKQVRLFINVIFFPFIIFGKKKINNQIYDEILVLPVSTLLIGGGSFFWLVGIVAFIAMITKRKIFSINTSIIAFFILIVGSLMVVSGGAFREERNSMKIYAYSASIIALVSCIVSIVALIWK